DGQHFLVMYLVVAFNQRERLGIEGYRMPLSVFVRKLGEYRTSREVRAVGFDSVWLEIVWRGEYRGGSDGSLETVEGFLLEGTPLEHGRRAGSIEQRSSDLGEVLDEPSIEVGETEESLYVRLTVGDGPLSNASGFNGIHRDSVVRDDQAEVFDFRSF